MNGDDPSSTLGRPFASPLFAPNRFKGKLIIVEGIDGSGQSTQITLLSQWLRSQSIAVAFSEWNSSPLVRETMRRGKRKKMLTPTTFSLLHATDFADRLERYILPLLKAGAVVCADRYAYTAFARDVARDVLARVRQEGPEVRLVVCDLSTSPYVDLAGASMLRKLQIELQKRGVRLDIAEAHAPVRDLLRAEGLDEKIGPINRFTTVADLIERFQQQTKGTEADAAS